MFIKRLENSIPITAVPEAQPEIASQLQTQTNLGVAGSADVFEGVAPNSFELVQQPQNLSPMQPALTNNTAVDASSVFSYLEVSASQQENRLDQLYERLGILKTKKEELANQIQDTSSKKGQLEDARNAVEDSLKNDKPLPEEIATALEGLGVIGVIGGVLTGLPVLSIFGTIVGGLSVAYKEKLKQAKNELESQMAEADQSAENFQSQVDDVNKEEDSVCALIEKYKQRLEQTSTERAHDADLVTADGPWEEFRPAESLTLNNDPPTAVQFSLDIQKFISEE